MHPVHIFRILKINWIEYSILNASILSYRYYHYYRTESLYKVKNDPIEYSEPCLSIGHELTGFNSVCDITALNIN